MAKTLKRKLNKRVNKRVKLIKKNKTNKKSKKSKTNKKSKINKKKITLRNLNKYMPYIMKKLNNKTKKRLIKLANAPLKPIKFFHNKKF